jgi:hypothetical protein
VAERPHKPKQAELDALVRALADLAADRARLAELDPEQRRRLLTIAGQLAHPLKPERRRLAKAFRARDRDQRRAHDAALVGRTGNRSRKLPRFVLPASTARAAGAPEPEQTMVRVRRIAWLTGTAGGVTSCRDARRAPRA